MLFRFSIPALMICNFAAAMVCATPARAQFEIPEIDLSDLDPTNPNGGLRRELRKLDKDRLDAMSRTPRAGRDYTKIYLKNNSRERISVALRVIPFEYSDGTSELKEFIPGSPWRTLAWYNLSPGERTHVTNTSNTILYTYAKASSGKVWRGSHRVNLGRETLEFAERRVGIDVPEEWTFAFSARDEDEERVAIRYTLWNATQQTVRFRLPSGETYSLNAGERNSYRNTGLARNLKIHVLNTGKQHVLTNGNHKFWWKRGENRVALDLKYDRD